LRILYFFFKKKLKSIKKIRKLKIRLKKRQIIIIIIIMRIPVISKQSTGTVLISRNSGRIPPIAGFTADNPGKKSPKFCNG
jgi:hypothetical protein